MYKKGKITANMCLSRLFAVAMVFFMCMVPSVAHAQKFGIKTNLLYDATGTVNLGVEAGLAKRWTLDISGNYNAWDFDGCRKWRHILVQPEARYWFCERFNGHFIGVHAHWLKYNVGHVKMPFGLWKSLRNGRYQGDMWGGGFSYGYQWLLGKHWNLEAEIGVGYGYVIYDKYPCAACGTRTATGHSNYFGPTKLGLSLIYLF